MADYEQYLVKSYSLWDLYLHKEQYPYLGRCYLAAKREDAKSIVDIYEDELMELGILIPIWFQTISKLYGADWPNVAILGNEWRHLHAHLIPRYNTGSRVFHGIKFEDPQPTKNYAPYPRMRRSCS